MDDLDRFIQNKENSVLDFSQRVEQRAAELEIAYRLRQARESRHLTQQQMAARSSISHRVISRIENAYNAALMAAEGVSVIYTYDRHFTRMPSVQAREP